MSHDDATRTELLALTRRLLESIDASEHDDLLAARQADNRPRIGTRRKTTATLSS